MGGFTSKTEDDLKFYLNKDYDITHFPTIIDRASKKAAIVHQITTDSTQQAHRIRTDVNIYKHINCQSITSIIEYIPLESTKICSDQEFHYIIEQDFNKYNLKDQFLARKYYKQKFSYNQIISIIKTFLCGINIYYTRFNRSFSTLIKLEALTVDLDHSNHLRLIDPIFMKERQNHSNQLTTTQTQNQESQTYQNQRGFILNQDHNTIRQPPEKAEIRKTKFNEKKVQLNELLADIYLVGILSLQIQRMEQFKRDQKHELISREIASISHLELSKIISLMTSLNPQDRGKVFDLIKINPQESYHLQNNFKDGKINPIVARAPNVNRSGINHLINQNVQKELKKETSFSFGTSFPQSSSSFAAKNNENMNLNITKQPQKIQPQFISNPKKNHSLSNMSTDRTICQVTTTTVRPSSQTNYHPIVNFSSGGYKKTISSSSVPGFVSYSSNLHSTSFSQNHIPTSASSSIRSPGLLSQRTNSFLVQQDKQQIFKQHDYSPFKKQQDTSPIISRDLNLQESNYKKIFDKYSHLNFQPYSFQQNSSGNRDLQEDIKKILKQSSGQGAQNNKKFKQVMTLNKQALQIDSPIDFLGKNKNNDFIMKDDFIKNQKFENNPEIPTWKSHNLEVSHYRPNKQVEEILKRLGIGSLLYGNSEINSNQQPKKEQKKSPRISNQKIIESQLDSNDFSHKGAYNIALNLNGPNEIPQNKLNQPKNQQNSKDEDDIPDRQTTPIRPVQKNKYNSTIVEVGDQDSQYSSSGVRNTENPIDMSDHQYVVEQYETGSRYEGYKVNGQRDGNGKFFYQDGGYYEGQWKNNKMHGWGKLYYQGGKLAYQGNWCQDEFHGFGKVYNDNPILLDCGFDFTNFDLLEDYWEYYEGMLVKDTKQGRGKIKLTNGEVFEGDFHNDRIQGFGKFFMRENTMVEGIWRDSKLIKIISS